MVSAPVLLILVVPVPPKATVLAERLVVEAPPESVVRPEKVRAVEVALLGNGYAMALVMTPVEEL